jgi:hypothetical protein
MGAVGDLFAIRTRGSRNTTEGDRTSRDVDQ